MLSLCIIGSSLNLTLLEANVYKLRTKACYRVDCIGDRAWGRQRHLLYLANRFHCQLSMTAILTTLLSTSRVTAVLTAEKNAAVEVFDCKRQIDSHLTDIDEPHSMIYRADLKKLS